MGFSIRSFVFSRVYFLSGVSDQTRKISTNKWRSYICYTFFLSWYPLTWSEIEKGSRSRIIYHISYIISYHIISYHIISYHIISQFSFLPLSPNRARGVLSSPAGRVGGRAGVTSHRYRSPGRSSYRIAVKLGGDDSWGRISDEFIHGRCGSLIKSLMS